jgi:hypothetical protein
MELVSDVPSPRMTALTLLKNEGVSVLVNWNVVLGKAEAISAASAEFSPGAKLSMPPRAASKPPTTRGLACAGEGRRKS